MESMEIQAIVAGLFTGKAQHLWEGKPPSAIVKHAQTGPLSLDKHGFVADEQADLRVHGGPEKAIHHYAADHLPFWQAQYPDMAASFVPGCFGENISTLGLDENTLCLGDTLSLGSALVQVCQGRQPCWKLNAHLGLPDLAMRFQKSGRTGWYYRVRQAGSVAVGDTLALVERPCPQWPLSRVIAARFNRSLDPDEAGELATLEALSQSWRSAFAKKVSRRYVEDTSPRLDTPS